MAAQTKTPTNGACNTVDGLTTEHSVHSDFCDTDAAQDYTSYDAHTWRYFSPWAISEGDGLRHAALGALDRVRDDFAITDSMASLHDNLVRLADEIRRMGEMVGRGGA